MKEECWDIRPFQMEVLKVFRTFERICEKHGWRYFTHGGTTLGALRHQGFIPWDDDFDILMPREDYNEMITIIRQELPRNLEFHRGDKEGPVYFSKIINKEEGIKERLCKATGLDLPMNPFIDIFVLDGLPNDVRDIGAWWRLRRILRCVQLYRYPQSYSGPRKKLFFARFLGCFMSIFIPKTSNNDEMMLLYDQLAMRWPYGAMTNIAEPAFFRMRTKRILTRAYYEPAREVPFEDGMIRIPAKAEELCENQYGDYLKLPPIEYRKPEHVFKKTWDYDRR